MDYEWRKDGVVITEIDFGRVLAGAQGGPVTVQLVNTSANPWTQTNVSLIQGDSDGGYGTAQIAGVTQDATPRNAGALAVGASLSLTLGWTTPAGTVGRVGDLASIIVDYVY